MDMKFFQMLELINQRLSKIEANISRIDEKMDYSLALQRNHLIRIKNGQDIDDQMILMGKPYNDLTPQRAYEIYKNPDADFILLDVSAKSFNPNQKIVGTIRIPLEELEGRYSELMSKTTPILVLSEKGLRSIQASELLVKKGYFNVNNISGGYAFWKGFSPDKGSLPDLPQG